MSTSTIYYSSHTDANVANADMDLCPLIPTLGNKSSKDFGLKIAYRNITAVPGKLFVHQVRAGRIARETNAIFCMQHTGSGKTRAMIMGLLSGMGTFGPGNNAIIICKESVKGYIVHDIRAVGAGNASASDVNDFYKFHTYHNFATAYGDKSDSELIAILGNSSFAIDEAHTLSSYVKARGDCSISPFDFIVRLRNLLPNNLFIVMSATPMLNSASELYLVARILLTNNVLQEAGVTCIDPSIFINEIDLPEDDPASAIDPTAIQDNYDNSGSNIDRFVRNDDSNSMVTAKCIADNVAILYQRTKDDVTRLKRGVRFQLDPIDNMENLAEFGYSVQNHPNIPTISQIISGEKLLKIEYGVEASPDEHIRHIMEMGDIQRLEYVNSFTKKGFYRNARALSICDYTAITNLIRAHYEYNSRPSLGEIRSCSALFAYWLEIELRAFAEGHWGVGSWYTADIVEHGAKLFVDILQLYGWVLWNPNDPPCTNYNLSFPLAPGITEPHMLQMHERPRVLLLTGNELVTGNMRQALTGIDNMRGRIIRTIVYSGAARDGISILNGLRSGAVPSWSEAAELQADSRHLRINSFDEMKKHIHTDEFKKYNAMYISPKGTSIVPIAYNAVSVPFLEHSPANYVINESLASLWPHYSVDIQMIAIRMAKSKQINKIFQYLVENSVDEIIENVPVEDLQSAYDGYVGTYMREDYIQHVKTYNPRNVHDYTTGKIKGIPDQLRPQILQNLTVRSPIYSVAGARTINGAITCGYRNLGLGHAPMREKLIDSKSTLNQISVDISRLIVPESNEFMKLAKNAVDVGIEHMVNLLANCGKNVRNASSSQFISFIGKDFLILLAVYSRLWVFTYTSNGIDFMNAVPEALATNSAMITELLMCGQTITQKYIITPSGTSPMIGNVNYVGDEYLRWYSASDARNIYSDPESLAYHCYRWLSSSNFEYVYVIPGGGSRLITYSHTKIPPYMCIYGISYSSIASTISIHSTNGWTDPEISNISVRSSAYEFSSQTLGSESRESIAIVQPRSSAPSYPTVQAHTKSHNKSKSARHKTASSKSPVVCPNVYRTVLIPRYANNATYSNRNVANFNGSSTVFPIDDVLEWAEKVVRAKMEHPWKHS